MSVMAVNETTLKRICDEHGDVIGEQNRVLGVVYIASGAVYIVLQMLCLCAIRQEDLLRNSCFKIMLIMCVIDVLTLCFSGLFTGLLSMIGASICTHPLLMSVSGHIGLGLWCCYAMLCILLGFNRCLSLRFPQLYSTLFSGSRTWYWILLPILYGTILGSPLEKPIIYNSRLGTWFFSPLPGVFNNGYTRTVASHTITNLSASILITAMYILIYSHLRHESKNRAVRQRVQTSTAKIRVLLQTFITCLVLIVGTISYVIMQVWPMPKFVYVLAQVAWLAINGCNSVIYLCLNRTIRRRVEGFILCRPLTYLADMTFSASAERFRKARERSTFDIKFVDISQATVSYNQSRLKLPRASTNDEMYDSLMA